MLHIGCLTSSLSTVRHVRAFNFDLNSSHFPTLSGPKCVHRQYVQTVSGGLKPNTVCLFLCDTVYLLNGAAGFLLTLPWSLKFVCVYLWRQTEMCPSPWGGCGMIVHIWH